MKTDQQHYIAESDGCTFGESGSTQSLESGKTPNHRRFCWLQGKPASGKSTLMKYIHTELVNKCGTKDASVIEFFYNERGGDAQRKHESMLRSLLYQLLSTRREIWDFERNKFKKKDSYNWQLDSLKRVFGTIRTNCRLRLTIYVLIDAMNESDEAQRVQSLKLLSSVYDPKTRLVMKILVASFPVLVEDDLRVERFASRFPSRLEEIY